MAHMPCLLPSVVLASYLPPASAPTLNTANSGDISGGQALAKLHSRTLPACPVLLRGRAARCCLVPVPSSPPSDIGDRQDIGHGRNCLRRRCLCLPCACADRAHCLYLAHVIYTGKLPACCAHATPPWTAGSGGSRFLRLSAAAGEDLFLPCYVINSVALLLRAPRTRREKRMYVNYLWAGAGPAGAAHPSGQMAVGVGWA